MSDVAQAVAVVGSRSIVKAAQFIKEFCPSGGWAQKAGLYKADVEAVGSYDQVYSRDDVDCIYIGTPHTDHYASAKAALEANKNVLCEKPVTVTADQARVLTTLAQTKGLFFMEGKSEQGKGEERFSSTARCRKTGLRCAYRCMDTILPFGVCFAKGTSPG